MTNNTNASEELLELVDEHDKIIGTVKKEDANRDPKLIHREVAIIIYDDKNRILFQQRSKNKEVYPGIWTISCAGHVSKGMSPKEAAHMELKEELSFDTALEYIDKNLYKLPNETHFTYWFKGLFPSDAKIQIEEKELEQARFFSEEEIKNLTNSSEKVDEYSVEKAKGFWRGKF